MAIEDNTRATTTVDYQSSGSAVAAGILSSAGPTVSSLASNTAANNGGSKTATILVSKTKTKTGLPLLLKNSIN